MGAIPRPEPANVRDGHCVTMATSYLLSLNRLYLDVTSLQNKNNLRIRSEEPLLELVCTNNADQVLDLLLMRLGVVVIAGHGTIPMQNEVTEDFGVSLSKGMPKDYEGGTCVVVDGVLIFIPVGPVEV